MGRRGPKKKPTELRVVEGSHARRKPHEPQAERAIPEPPPWFNKDAREIYNYVAETCSRLGVVTKADGLMLALLADSLRFYVHCVKAIDEKGLVDQGHRGEKLRIEAQQIHRFRDGVMRLGACFGLSPADRVGLIDEASAERMARDKKFFGA